MRSDGDWRSIFRWCASIISSYLGVKFRVESQPRTTKPFLNLELVARSTDVFRVKIDERHVLERNNGSKLVAGWNAL